MATCVWVKQGAEYDPETRAFTPAIYCDKPVGYRMVEDGGEPGAEKVRLYNSFCDEHQARGMAATEDAEG
jgi:hypothetical protein